MTELEMFMIESQEAFSKLKINDVVEIEVDHTLELISNNDGIICLHIDGIAYGSGISLFGALLDGIDAYKSQRSKA